MKRTLHFLSVILILTCVEGQCQETVFGLLKKDVKLADTYYEEKNFLSALDLYKNARRKDPSSKEISIKVARCHYFLKQYAEAVSVYEKYMNNGRNNLPWSDVYLYAESQAANGNYQKAIEYYKKGLAREPDNELVIKKIWRLHNALFLYEDSSHYAVRPISLNTEYGELCAVPYREGIIFMSNRKEVQLVENVDATNNAPFYRIYYAPSFPDSASGNNTTFTYGKASVFNKELSSKFHAGPVAFYDHFKSMVFVSTASESGTSGRRTLQLYFAEEKDGAWHVVQEFPYNSKSYSITNPTISTDGKILYFASDMGGGFGGQDLYRSNLVNNQWTQPVNLGENVNTVHDEVFPYLHLDRILYFSSDGHPGLGGLDIFRTDIVSGGFTEPQNAGYPLNTYADDFGIIIDSMNTHGYFSSNRKKGGYNDDLYEFDMDLQTYPLTISGVIKYKEHNWKDTTELKLLPNAKIYVIDNTRNVTVYEGSSDFNGNFTMVIPYFTNFKIRVRGEDNDEHIASLEIPKYRKSLSTYEIVVVKDHFKPNGQE